MLPDSKSCHECTGLAHCSWSTQVVHMHIWVCGKAIGKNPCKCSKASLQHVFPAELWQSFAPKRASTSPILSQCTYMSAERLVQMSSNAPYRCTGHSWRNKCCRQLNEEAVLIPVKAICRPWWWYIMLVTPSNRKPSNLYSSTHQRALDSRKRKLSQLPAHNSNVKKLCLISWL